MIKCCICNEKIKGTGKKLKTCRKCSQPVCPMCRSRGYCNECNPELITKKVVDDYFYEKYRYKSPNPFVIGE